MSAYGACSQQECGCLHFDQIDDENPKMCDCGHKRCFHAVLTSAGTPRNKGGKSVSELVAPIFEREVNDHLNVHLSHSLPHCGLSDFRTREVEDQEETLLEIGSFGYMSRDSLEFGVGSPGSGITLIEPKGCTRKNAVAAPPVKLTGSAGAKERSLETKVEKYVIGETYSGQKETKIKEKVSELEVKINKMVERFDRLNTNPSADVTSVVGATLLAYSCGAMNRKDALRKFGKYVTSTLMQDLMPNLWRLAQARRLYLVVLSANDSPFSTVQRENFAVTEGIDITLRTIEEKIDKFLNKK